MYYPRLLGTNFTAERLNVTCPPADWEALLAAPVTSNSTTSTTAGLAPCATATVSSGQELVSALERLQPGAARLLISMAANISLPSNPTSQRAYPAPGDDDAVPLTTVYRNVTLAGGLRGRTEVNLRGRRNAFGLQAGWELLRQQGAQQLEASGSGAVWRGRPVLVMADLSLVNAPPGSPVGWPLALLGIFHHYAGLDRSGGAGLQLVGLRSGQVLQPIDIGYIGFWYNRMISLLSSERDSAAWLLSLMEPLQVIRDVAGGRTVWGHVGDYVLAYNSSSSPIGLLTPPGRSEYDLTSSAPAGLLLQATNGSSVTTFTLPPSSFAVARNATQLLALLQEPWSGGPRVILLLENMTLTAGQWPQVGAALSYNVTLAGPVSGSPVLLDTAGLPLARAAGAGRSGGGGGLTVVVLLQRLVLRGMAPPLLVAERQDVAAAGGELAGTDELRAWRDRCLLDSGGIGTNSSAAQVLWEVRNCTLELSEDTLQLLRLYNDPAACPSTANTSAATAVCALMRSATPLPALLAALLGGSLAVQGQASFGASSTTNTSAPGASISVAFATLGAVTLAGSTAVAASPTQSLSGYDSVEAAEPACSVAALAMALVPQAAAPSTSGGRSRTAAVAGGAAAGASVAALCMAGAAVALFLRRRRKLQGPLVASKAATIVKLEHSGGAGGAGDPKSSCVGVAVLLGSDATNTTSSGLQRGATTTVATAEATASAAVMASRDDNGFSISFVQQGDGVSSLANSAAGPTMAESVFLGASMPRPGPQTGVAAVQVRPASVGTGQRPQRRSMDKAAAPPSRLRSQELQANILGTCSSGPSSGPRSNLRSAVADEIETMIRKCQAIANEPSAGLQAKGRRMRVLGRGAHGAVYLGEWRGMPAAIKVVVLGADASATRRERLVREVALTMTLEHPHVVPTYHFEVGAVRADDGATERSVVTGPEAYSGDDDSDVAALRLKLVMQYCEGGTLRAALQAGRFSTLSPATPAQAVPPVQPAVTAAASVPARQAAPPTADEAAESSAALPAQSDAPSGAELSSGPAQLLGQRSLETPGSSAPVPSVSSHRGCQLEWGSITASTNLPLCLLAGLDILRGLEYLHGRGVVHGDLTENNVLLKAAQPTLPQPQSRLLLQAHSTMQGSCRARIAHMLHTGSLNAGDVASRPATAASVQLAARQAGLLGPAPQPDLQPRLTMQQEPSSKSELRPASSSGVEVTLAQNACMEGPTGGGGPSAPPGGGALVTVPEAADISGPAVLPSLLRSRPSLHVSLNGAATAPMAAALDTGSDTGLQSSLPTHGSVGLSSGPSSNRSPFLPMHAHQQLGSSCSGDGIGSAAQMLTFIYKIADFGLSVQLQGGSETHLSNMSQGTPFFAAPEVVQYGRLAPAADIYSFGVLLWLLLHGVSLGQLRHLLPRTAHAPIAPLLLRHASRSLPPAAHYLLARSLALESAERPTATGLRQMLEDVMRDVAGPQLSWLLLSSERKEFL